MCQFGARYVSLTAIAEIYTFQLRTFHPNKTVNKKKSRNYKKQGIKNFLFLYYIQVKSGDIADKNPNVADDDERTCNYRWPLVPVFYVPMCFMYLCAYVPSRFTCPCAYVIHFYTLYCLCLYILRAFARVNTSALFIYTAFFKNILVIPVSFSQYLFSSHRFSVHIFQCFHLFDVVRAQTYL